MEARQRAPLEGEVKDEIEAEAGMPREESAIQRELGLRYVDHLKDQFLGIGLPDCDGVRVSADRGSNHVGRRGGYRGRGVRGEHLRGSDVDCNVDH